jgi:predicted secreted protein
MNNILEIHKNEGNKFEIGLGDTIRVILEELATTGYRWQIVFVDNEILSVLGSEYLPYPGNTIGGGGSRVFMFKAKSFGTTTIKFTLRRAWEPELFYIDNHHLQIIVK